MEIIGNRRKRYSFYFFSVPPIVQNMTQGRPNIQYKDLVILATLLGYGNPLITDEIGIFICKIFPYFATLEGPAKKNGKVVFVMS